MKSLAVALSIIIGLGLMFPNRKYLDYYENYSQVMDFQIFGLLIIAFGLSLRLIPMLRRIVTHRLLLACCFTVLISQLFLSIMAYNVYEEKLFLEAYDNMNCKELLERFEEDVQNRRFAFFSYGIFAGLSNEENLEKKYKIDLHVKPMGCIGSTWDHCLCLPPKIEPVA